MIRDTMPEAARVRIAALAAMSGSDRLDAALEISDSVRALAEAGREARERTKSRLDQNKIEAWVRDLGLQSEWQRAREGADTGSDETP